MTWLRQNLRIPVALALIAITYWFSRMPELSSVEREQLRSEFQFQKERLPVASGRELKSVRPVHPKLEHLSAWISSVGAACTLTDLDGDGLANDVVHVETRTNQVILSPVPGTGARYAPFVLDDSGPSHSDETVAPMGSLAGDWNEDGLTDVMVYYWGRPPLMFLQRSRPDAIDSAVLSPDAFVLHAVSDPEQRWYTNAATQADFDGDGHIDLAIGNYFQDGAHILDPSATDDQQMHHAMSRALNGGTNRLLLGQGGTSGREPTVSFRMVNDAWTSDVAHGWTLAMGACDLDGDMLPELYCANDFGNDRLLHNRSRPGKPAFAVVDGTKRWNTSNSKVLGHDSFKGMGVDFGDLNGDGWMDIYVSNIAAVYALEESHFVFLSTGDIESFQRGKAPYEESSEQLGLARSGWGWEARLADFNNDGVLEAIQATGFVRGTRNRWPQLHEAAMGNDLLLRYPAAWHRVQPGDDLSGHDINPLFVRSKSGRFYDLSVDLQIADPQVTRGIATADIDGDGDLDFVIANQWDDSWVYQNTSSRAGKFLGLKLFLGDQASGSDMVVDHPTHPVDAAPAIGALVRAHLPDGRMLVSQVDGGNGHSGKRSPDVHFGLGQIPDDAVVSVDIRWRDRRGNIHSSKHDMTPGWHTLVMGGSQHGRQASRRQATNRFMAASTR
ncbi:MAG: FG-GAP-like repeat-containing protein [Pirellulaceae bacterium]